MNVSLYHERGEWSYPWHLLDHHNILLVPLHPGEGVQVGLHCSDLLLELKLGEDVSYGPLLADEATAHGVEGDGIGVGGLDDVEHPLLGGLG